MYAQPYRERPEGEPHIRCASIGQRSARDIEIGAMTHVGLRDTRSMSSRLPWRQKTTDRRVYLFDLFICFHFGSFDLFDFRGSIFIATTQFDNVRQALVHCRTAVDASGQL